jgi:ribA/ribD-fused uncharacterized protein
MDTPLVYQGISYPTVEHFYQAMKTPKDALDVRRSIAACRTAGQAKRLGRGVDLRPDWEFIKVDVMRGVLQQKFAPGTWWYGKLMKTGDEAIVEWNRWHDNFWGDCTCDKCKTIPGQNLLGRLLMEIRENGR